MNNNNHSTATRIPEEVTLSRDLGLFTITMIGVGGMIGAGIFVLTGIASGVADSPHLCSQQGGYPFRLYGLWEICLLLFRGWSRLSIMCRKSLGGALGFQSGWMSWFAHMVAGSLYSLGFGAYAAHLLTSAGALAIILPLVREVQPAAEEYVGSGDLP